MPWDLDRLVYIREVHPKMAALEKVVKSGSREQILQAIRECWAAGVLESDCRKVAPISLCQEVYTPKWVRKMIKGY